MEKNKLSAYFATSLANSTPQIRDEIKEIRTLLGNIYYINDYFGYVPDADPKVVFEYDTGQIRQSDIVVAECSNPSLGVGFEIAYALSLGKKVVAIAKDGATVGKMITGNPQVIFFRYKNPDDLLMKLNSNL